jgi:hypothetical protein
MLDSPNAILDRAQYRLLQPTQPPAVLFDPNVERTILRLGQGAPPALAPETLLLFGDPPYARHLLDRDPLEANWHGPACRLLGAAASPKWDRLALRRAASSAQKPLVPGNTGTPLPAAEGQSPSWGWTRRLLHPIELDASEPGIEAPVRNMLMPVGRGGKKQGNMADQPCR